MIEQIMSYCNNYFYKARELGKFSIVSGKINNMGIYKPSQYIKIVGSDFNDGVYKIDSIIDGKIVIASLEDEIFDGVIFALSVPRSFLNTIKDIEAYKSSSMTNNNPYTSESFENYSYTKATNKDGIPLSWLDIFKEELKPYRKLNDGVRFVKPIQLQAVVTSSDGGVLMTNDNEGIEVVK